MQSLSMPPMNLLHEAELQNSPSNSARTLPGCRPCGLNWDECELAMTTSNDNTTIHFRMGNMEWMRHLQKIHGKLKCNLQELEVLRWIVEEEPESDSAVTIGSCTVEYTWQERYSCLFPHQGVAAHQVVEISPGMSKENLKTIGEEAIQDHTMLLCPALAPTCPKEQEHPDVSDEVCAIAALWPVRQTFSAEAVAGIVDIVPVAICGHSRQDEECVVFATGGTKKACTPEKARAHTPRSKVDDILRTLEKWVPLNYYKRRLDLALHESWHSDILSVIQPAVLGCQSRPAIAQPTRLYDTYDRTHKSGLRPEYYLALSYCWGEWEDDDELRDRVGEISKRLEIRYFWIDKWCIDQNDPADKAREIHRMGEYYMGASACLVLPRQNIEPFQCVPQHDGIVLRTFQQLMLNTKAIGSLLRCQWATRVWTLQEAFMSRQTIYAIQDQLIDGDFVSELLAYIDTAGHEYDSVGWIGGYGCYRWGPRLPSVFYSRHFGIENQRLVLIRSVFGSEQQYQELKSSEGRVLMPFEEAIGMVTFRSATKEQDFVYGVLGLTKGGENISIEYDIGWETMLSKLIQAGMITERQLASPTVNGLPGMSWLPAMESNSRHPPTYGPFTQGEMIASPIARPPLSWSKQGAEVFGAVIEWVDPKFRDLPTVDIYGFDCEVANGWIWFPGTPGLIARVAGTSSFGFNKERLSGTHVMLCKDIDEYTPSTVVMIVSGDIESGHVYRTDGYVLEFHGWVAGNLQSLQGRNWIVGGVPESQEKSPL